MPASGSQQVRPELIDRGRRIAEEVAAAHADDVDRNARFPSESLDALRRERLLSAALPSELGGEGANLAELAQLCSVLAQGCATTSMVYAMHQIQVLCILRHAQAGSPLWSYLADLAERQRLIASATSELGVGGDIRTSRCAIEAGPSGFTLEKQASVISYGDSADDILATARRAADAAPSDQVLVLVRRGEFTLERVGGWDTLGMRGTCSFGYKLRASSPIAQVLPVPFADISAQTMHPVSHILWTHVWLGLATAAVATARRYVRAEARKTPGVVPPNALRVAELVNQLHMMRGAVREAMYEYVARDGDADELSSLGFQIRMNNLKIAAAEQVVPVVQKAMAICGISGYRNDTPYSLGRHLRDAFGAMVMILNDRLYGTNASLLLVSKED